MAEKPMYREMMTDLERTVSEGGTAEEVLKAVCDYLCREHPECDWAGYYLVDPSAEGELFLGPYAGAPTEHDRIRFGEGVCGQAASGLKTFLVDDVAEEDNYLSCSPEVRSEIVVPVFHEGVLAGEIDLDSHHISGFGPEDGEFLEWLAGLTAEFADRARKGEGGS
ncbi:MAG: hypothetical protein AVO35_05615 [Candidatus Aegiribacteria sp. MLS_C]|nr:MAG: hypothetical protein AVO35_05615 [Candidatus Aegiribacteria sp. MLS_C]